MIFCKLDTFLFGLPYLSKCLLDSLTASSRARWIMKAYLGSILSNPHQMSWQVQRTLYTLMVCTVVGWVWGFFLSLTMCKLNSLSYLQVYRYYNYGFCNILFRSWQGVSTGLPSVFKCKGSALQTFSTF